jgi:hypothetical protein
MTLDKVLFIGGDAARLASVQIRCVDIATRLGCDQLLKVKSLDEIPQRYTTFVCVKSTIDQLDLEKLQKRGVVIWDVIDALPPKWGVDVYLTSSLNAQKSFAAHGRVEMIRHHHCNNNLQPNRLRNRRPVWIGGRHWCPDIPGLQFDKHLVEGVPQEKIVKILREIGLSLNLRAESSWGNAKHPEKLFTDFHISINPGVKLINCIGFGIPSVSGDEPAYREIDDDCTIFSSAADYVGWVKELQANDRLYNRLRKNCLKHAKDYHIDTIIGDYKKLFRSL